MELEAVIQSAIIPTIVTAIIGPLIFFGLRRWDEKNRRNFEIRFSEYKHYLKALEQISSTSHAQFEEFMTETYAKCLNEILASEGQSSDPVIRLNEELNHLMAGIRTSFSQATGELNGLRLVCSDKLLEMINDYVNIQRKLMDESCAVLRRLEQIDLADPTSMFSGEMKAEGERSQQLFEDIVRQMRSELKIG